MPMTRLTGARVLLTGATGLIGRATAAALAGLGAEVIALSRSGRSVPGAVRAVACDLLDMGAMTRAVGDARATHLVHLAWADGADRWHSPVNDDWAGATSTLLQCFADGGGRRALIAGSCAEYDWTGPGLLAETAPLRPATRYGQAKARAGEAARAAAPGLGVALVWARPFFVFGPGEPEGRLVGDLVRGLRAGRAWWTAPTGCSGAISSTPAIWGRRWRAFWHPMQPARSTSRRAGRFPCAT